MFLLCGTFVRSIVSYRDLTEDRLDLLFITMDRVFDFLWTLLELSISYICIPWRNKNVFGHSWNYIYVQSDSYNSAGENHEV